MSPALLLTKLVISIFGIYEGPTQVTYTCSILAYIGRKHLLSIVMKKGTEVH